MKNFSIQIILVILIISISTSHCKISIKDQYNKAATMVINQVIELQRSLKIIAQDPNFKLEDLSSQHRRLLLEAQKAIKNDPIDDQAFFERNKNFFNTDNKKIPNYKLGEVFSNNSKKIAQTS